MKAQHESKTVTTRDRKTDLRAVTSLGLAAAAGSVLGIFARALGHDLTVVQQIAARCTLGALLLIVVAGVQNSANSIRQASRNDVMIAAVRGILLYGVGVTLSAFAFIHGNYGAVSMVLALPVVAVMGALWFGDKPGVWKWALVGCAFVGAALIALSEAAYTGEGLLPLSAAFAAAVFMAVGFVGQRAQGTTLPARMTAIVMLSSAASVTGIVSLGQVCASGTIPSIDRLPLVMALCTGAAVLSTVNLLATNFGMVRVDSATANNVLALQPVFATIVGLLLYREVLSPLQLVGGIMILTSVVLLPGTSRLRRRRGHQDPIVSSPNSSLGEYVACVALTAEKKAFENES